MKIIIVGGGKVGYTLAQQLTTEEHDVILIDNNPVVLNHADETLDIMCIRGNGASAEILKEANINGADLLIAVTDGDELNMICCVIGKKLGAKHTVARIRNTDYSNEYKMLKQELELDMVINPEMDAADELARMVQFPSATNVETFANNMLEMVEFRVLETDPIINIKLMDLTKKLPSKVLFCAVRTNNEIIIPNGNYTFNLNDTVYVIGERGDISKFFSFLGRSSHKAKNVTIIGGSRIAIYLTWLLNELGMHTKIIEINKGRCVLLSEMLNNALIICGDGTDQEVLDNENIQTADAMISLTDMDEENLISSLYAHQCGVPKVILKINRHNYIPIVKRLGLDSIISPKLTTANNILRYVRALDNSQGIAVEKLYKILDDQAEVAEFTAKNSPELNDIKLKDLNLKKDILIAAIVRNKKIIIPYGDDCIKQGDKVIVVTKTGFISDLSEILEN
ncbi:MULTISPECIES: Trk system potassium transporter TrkA [unclassified Sedimentibacter]|uniref:Trk system potassium transporter TrkA n=1 Tax=unclassified Sedimentibacter TaxID=2649220 RepID=UPI0027E101DB|nr:Trk system potassium transporter TrkA [Sedimentibacter sp. MB35-C1]WMJ75776.1 Trk system potassium transporter TrkA [Sedimentibacter sp. MB35-C1]